MRGQQLLLEIEHPPLPVGGGAATGSRRAGAAGSAVSAGAVADETVGSRGKGRAAGHSRAIRAPQARRATSARLDRSDDWRLDDSTRLAGRRGLAAARAVLAALPDPPGADPAATASAVALSA